MSKRLVIWATIVLLLAFGLAALWFWLETPPGIPASSNKELAEEYAKANGRLEQANMATQVVLAPLDLSHPVRLAIGSLGLPDDSQNAQLADLVLNNLGEVGGLELVDRQSLERVLREQSLSLSGLLRAKDAIRVGELLHADWFLFGTTATAEGTNATVVRLVDARTGILLNVGVLSQQGGQLALAQSLADFVRETRANASRPMTRIYLALGAMEDLSVNNRQINFPNDLRSYLMTAFRNSNVTVLEREYVDSLWQEVQLDLAGLTDDHETKHLPIQSTCWMVSGCYQSYENNGYEVEAVLDVNQVIGRYQTHKTFRGKPGVPLFQQIQQAIDTEIRQATNSFVPTRRTEAFDQMMVGEDLLQAGRAMPGNDFHFGLAFTESMDRQLGGAEKLQRRHNLQEAIKAFQTVLVLTPTNREAKLCLAECFQNPTVDRLDEAREIYRQLLEEPVDDKFVMSVKMALIRSFDGLGPWVSGPWYAEAARRSNNPQTKAYFQNEADRANGPAQPGIDDLAEAGAVAALARAQSNLLVNLQDPHYAPSGAMAIFAQTFGTNDAAAAKALADYLPVMQARFPQKRFELQAAVLIMQTDTNAELLREFQNTLDWCEAHPNEVTDSENFWSELKDSLLPWSLQHACFGIAERIISHDELEFYRSGTYPESERLFLALEYFQHQQWDNALKVFQAYSNRPVMVNAMIRTCDQLSYYHGPVLTGQYAADCEKKLGKPHVADPREFEIGRPVLMLDANSTFAAGPDGIWIAGPIGLRHLNPKLQPDFQMSLPLNDKSRVNCFCVGPNNVWLGTSGAGLMQITRAEHQFKHFGVPEGLLMDSVLQLQLDGDTLWIGYGGTIVGGLGQYSLTAQQFHSYMTVLGNRRYRPDLDADQPNEPPRHPVIGLSIEPSGNILALVSGSGLQRLSVKSNTWATLPDANGFRISSIAANTSYLVRGVGVPQYEVDTEIAPAQGSSTNRAERKVSRISQESLATVPVDSSTNQFGERIRTMVLTGVLADKGALEISTFPKESWRTLRDANGIPNPPSRLALSGDMLWVGGDNYLACVDLADLRVVKYCYFAGAVQGLQIAGSEAWAQVDGWLYRLPASGAP